MNNYRLMSCALAVLLLTTFISHTLYVRPQLVERDGEYFIKIQVPSSFGTDRFTERELPAELINTSRSNVNVDNDDVCAYAAEPALRSGISPRGIIACRSGASFTNVHSVTGSATGTPSHTMYSNYIGEKRSPSRLVIDRPGSARRVTYCDGICKK